MSNTKIPSNSTRHIPLVLVHGCCLTAKTWETTPDGRMGWSEYFVRSGRAVYLADQVGRGRSGFDGRSFLTARDGGNSPSTVPSVVVASQEVAWTVFRFGPQPGVAFPDEQFPLNAVGEMHKQMVPDLTANLPTPNPTWRNLAATRVSGSWRGSNQAFPIFPQQAALVDAKSVNGIVTIEPPLCPDSLTTSQLATLAKIPTLVVFGDHLDARFEVSPVHWTTSFSSCQNLIKQLRGAGGDAEMMHLPERGIRGNSHMLMQDRNNVQIADLVVGWIEKHVERTRKSGR